MNWKFSSNGNRGSNKWAQKKNEFKELRKVPPWFCPINIWKYTGPEKLFQVYLFLQILPFSKLVQKLEIQIGNGNKSLCVHFEYKKNRNKAPSQIRLNKYLLKVILFCCYLWAGICSPECISSPFCHWFFPFRISSVNAAKSTGFYVFGHIYWTKPSGNT